MRVAKHWNRFPREAVDALALSLSGFRRCLDNTLNNTLLLLVTPKWSDGLDDVCRSLPAGLPFCQPVHRGYGGFFLEGAL